MEWRNCQIGNDCGRISCRRSTRDGSSSKEDEENLALVSKERKGKEKDSHPKSNSSHGDPNWIHKELSGIP